MRFARRTDWELTPNKISGILDDFKARGQAVLDLTESNPTRCGLVYPHKELLSALSDDRNMVYSPSTKGLLASREAVAAYYAQKNIHVSPEQIFLTASTSEAYSFVFRLLADPGQSILFPAPSYPLFDFLVDLNDLERGFYPLEYADRWMVDFDGVEENMNENTKALVTVNPNNPTGSFIKKDELTRLNKICKARQCALISDEVFFDYAWGSSADTVSFAGNQENLTFTMGGLSKTLGLPQMKLSWTIVSGPQDVVKDAINRLEVIADTYLSVNTPVQNALTSWLTLRPGIQKTIIDRVRINRDYLLTNFDAKFGNLLQTEGGWYNIIKLADGIDEEEIVEELLVKDYVYVHPGYFFNFSEEPYLILSLLPPPETFSEGAQRILARLRRR
jgi:alanine-synthesizing transaminase